VDRFYRGSIWIAGFVIAACACPSIARELSFEERVKAQEAIERVYYSHQLGTTKPFEEAVPREAIERRVHVYLKQSVALATRWKTPVTAEALEREWGRIAERTRFPDRLEEVIEALGHDRVLVLECFVRPLLVDRLARGVPGERADRFDESQVTTVATEGPLVAPSSCPAEDSWVTGVLASDAPAGRTAHTAVWTGTVMLLWGGSPAPLGFRYDPLIDTWRPISSTGEPSARSRHSAVWTGSEMIVWGGSVINDGGRYDPISDSWSAISTAGAPQARTYHSAVWTGTRMLVWGGYGGDPLGDGASYDPGSNTWSPIAGLGAPSPRYVHGAVWTGTQMIVWGGRDGAGNLGDGARYNLASNTWSPMSSSGAPAARSYFTAIWTGAEMIVWGGNGTTVALSTGARYDPIADGWTPTPTSGAPSPRQDHVAAWSGQAMMIWGGTSTASLDSGGLYQPSSNTWSPTSTSGAPSPRGQATAVWTGSRVIVWGGFDGFANSYPVDGGRYDPASNSWTPTSTGRSPSARRDHTAVWTGTAMLVWGGDTGDQLGSNFGRRYDPTTDNWTLMSQTGAPVPRHHHTATWTGTKMIVWGGFAGASGALQSGGLYDPFSDSWAPTSLDGAPTARLSHTAVWTGSRMIVWGGRTELPQFGAGFHFKTGGLYDPVHDTWTPTSETDAPLARGFHTAVWTGSRMVVWGGALQPSGPPTIYDSGGRYDPSSNTWVPTSLDGAPTPRVDHVAAWTGSRMIVFGGRAGGTQPNTGSLYDPVGDTWVATNTAGAPTTTTRHAAIWNGSRLLVWSGPGTDSGRYDPGMDQWSPMAASGSPATRSGHSGVWASEQFIVWGGTTGAAVLGDGGIYISDGDLDGFVGSCDNCPGIPHAGQADGDGDGVGDLCDNCVTAPNHDQTDLDHDGLGDACDSCPFDPFNDADQDGACADADNCPGATNPTQADQDGDGLGNACDACPQDAQNDADGDGACGNTDNCPGVGNRAQLDSDADGRGDLCDNCPAAANPAQDDLDGDGAGDACDCQPIDPNDRRPGEVQTLSVAKTSTTANLSWTAVTATDSYSVMRGDLASKGASQYGTCQGDGLTTTSFDDTTVPAPGQGYFYLVQAQSYDCGLGSLGTTSSEQARTNTNALACQGIGVNDARASAESNVFGTVVGTFTNTQSSNDVHQSMTEVPSSGGGPNRFSQLEHRWTIAVGSGTKKELHVEGFRSSSTDGDDFRFEYSTNGGSSFTAVTMTSLPLADNGIDLIATLPGGLIGSVIVRVVDTDRTAGHQGLDTVSIDELWVRAVP
jgi:N-acetylneuraminic acid mutarotase